MDLRSQAVRTGRLSPWSSACCESNCKFDSRVGILGETGLSCAEEAVILLCDMRTGGSGTGPAWLLGTNEGLGSFRWAPPSPTPPLTAHRPAGKEKGEGRQLYFSVDTCRSCPQQLCSHPLGQRQSQAASSWAVAPGKQHRALY